MKILPPILILAGGKAKRLRPLTNNQPKILIEINKKPFLEYLIKNLSKYNFKKIYLLTGYKSYLVKKYLKKKNRSKIKIKVVCDGKNLLGTGGSVKQCLININNEFFVMYGDTILDINYNKFYMNFKKKNSIAQIAIYKNKNKLEKSNIVFNKKIIDYDKQSSKAMYIDYGLMIFKKKGFLLYEKKRFDLSKIIKLLIQKKKLDTYIVKKRFYEIGNLNSLKEFRKVFK